MSYIGREPVPHASRYIQEGVIDLGTNTINIVGGYSVNNIVVYVNGIRKDSSEYTANDGVSIVFDVSLNGGDTYVVEEFRTFELDEVDTKIETSKRAELVKSTEAASNGRVTVRFTAKGQPCFFVKIPAFNCEDIAPGGELGTGLHPAFLFNGNPKPYILVGQYLSSVVDGEYVSQPNRIPDASRTYDQELALAAATGSGFKVLSNWDWAAVALWCMANGFQPEGNTDWGRHHVSKWDTAIRYDGNAPGVATGNGRTYTGSGPVKWSHSNHVSGIFDMVGNVWERVSGLKLIDNIFHIAPDNGVYTEAQYTNTGVAAPTDGTFSSRGTTTSIPLRRALAFPVNSALAPVGYFYKDATGERIPVRGGGWNNTSNAGLGALNLNNARSHVSSYVGSRLAFSD